MSIRSREQYIASLLVAIAAEASVAATISQDGGGLDDSTSWRQSAHVTTGHLPPTVTLSDLGGTAIQLRLLLRRYSVFLRVGANHCQTVVCISIK